MLKRLQMFLTFCKAHEPKVLNEIHIFFLPVGKAEENGPLARGIPVPGRLGF